MTQGSTIGYEMIVQAKCDVAEKEVCSAKYWIVLLCTKEGNESVSAIVQPDVYLPRDPSPLCKGEWLTEVAESFTWKARAWTVSTGRTGNQSRLRRSSNKTTL